MLGTYVNEITDNSLAHKRIQVMQGPTMKYLG